MSASSLNPQESSKNTLRTAAAAAEAAGTPRGLGNANDDALVATAPAVATAPPMLMTLNEVAAELRCARRSVERHISAHKLDVVRFGRCVRVERGELARFIASHTERIERMERHTDATSA